MMDALEVGRVNVAPARRHRTRALELALRYSQERKTFGKPIASTRRSSSSSRHGHAARGGPPRELKAPNEGRGIRSDLEAGMAKLIASETGRFCVEESFRIHGGYGYSKEYEIERLYRDAPLLLIGEGTSEIQRMVIGKKLSSATRSRQPTGRRTDDSPGFTNHSMRAQDLIATAYRKLILEIPALDKLKLVIRVELRGRGDVQVFASAHPVRRSPR